MKKYYRSKTDNVISGVCGGFGEYFNIDPIFIRLAFSFLLLIFSNYLHDAGQYVILLYLVLWFSSSERPPKTNEQLTEIKK